LLLTPVTKELHPSFNYVICSIEKYNLENSNNGNIAFKIFLLLDYRYVESTSEYWTKTSNLLKNNNFRFDKGDENPLANIYWVRNESITLLERGSVNYDVTNYIYTALLSQYPIQALPTAARLSRRTLRTVHYTHFRVRP
jgi:hypothetical protein